jgi:hypothetical protein
LNSFLNSFLNRTVARFFGILVFATGVMSHAAYSNYSSVLIGERASGMGGAFTALSGDPAATPFINPATTVLMGGNSLSATVNVYNKYATNLGEATDFKEAPQRLNRGFFRSLPAASGTLMHFRSFAVGISILVPDYDIYSGQLKGAENVDSFMSHVDESLWVGGTFSGRLTERDSIGLSIYYTARNMLRTALDRVTTGGGTGAVITSEEKNLTANAVVPVFGFSRKLSPNWSLGLSYRAPSLPIAGEATYYRATTDTTPYSTTVINKSGLTAVTIIPARFSMGAAREIKGANTVSFDVSLYEGTSYRDLPDYPEGTDMIHHEPVVNFALGYEQILRSWLTLRLGVFTNHSSHPPPDQSQALRQGDRVDMMGFSANLNVLTREQTSFTFGGYYNGGSGQSAQRVGQEFRVIPKSQQVFTMLLATGFRF